MNFNTFHSDHSQWFSYPTSNHPIPPYLGPVKSHPGKDGLRDACSLQLLPHTLVDFTWHITRPHGRPGRCLGWRPGCGASPWAALRLLRGLGIRGFGEDLGRSPRYRGVVEILLWGRRQTLAGQHTAHSVLLVEKLGHDQLLVHHLGSEGLGHKPGRSQAEGRATAYVGYSSMREKKGRALLSRASCDWLLGEGNMCRLLRKAVNVWWRRRKAKTDVELLTH